MIQNKRILRSPEAEFTSCLPQSLFRQWKCIS